MQKTDINIRDSYKRYLSVCKKPVSTRQYLDLTSAYLKFIFDKILDGEEVTMPGRMSTLAIQGHKRKLRFNLDGTPKLPPNWSATKRLWERDPKAKEEKKLIYCLNEETGGVVYRLHWKKASMPLEDKIYYSFILTRDNKRAIHKKIKEGKEYLIKT